jgi:hypothetical protein
MVQVLESRKRPSFGQKFSNAVGAGLQGGQQLMQQQQQQKMQQQAVQTAKDHFGIDITGFDPETQKALLVEAFKQQGKGNRDVQKQDFVNKLFGGGQGQQQQNQGNALRGEQEPGEQPGQGMQSPQGFDAANISDEDIIKATATDRDIGNALAKAKETATRKTLGDKKEVTESFKENQDYITKVYDAYEDSLRREAIFDRMDQLEDSGELSDSGMVNFLELIGLKPEWLKNPANEEYSKLSLDLLGGGTLQADYGSRVLASEFKVSLQRIPTLSQTPEGRKQIKENIRTMLLPAKLKQERMTYYIDKAKRTGQPLPHDLRGQVLKDIKPQLEEAYDKFKQRNGRYPVRDGTIPNDDAIQKYYYLSNGNEAKAFKMMREDGYDTNE